MGREFKLRPAPGDDDSDSGNEGRSLIDRRRFNRYAFNASAGVITMASLGSIGFASMLMGQASTGGGDSAVKYWVPMGSEDTVWYGANHLKTMKKSDFESEAAKSSTGMAGAQGLWSGLPVNVVYVPHDENAGTPLQMDKPRMQFADGYTDLGTGKYVGHGDEMLGTVFEPHDNLLVIFSRCPHLCCIPGWQLVANPNTADNWVPGGVDTSGNKLFCICHSSRYDPTVLEMNENRNRSNGETFQYFGILRTGGPAPVGMPLIPFEVNADVIEALPDYMDWYTYCD